MCDQPDYAIEIKTFDDALLELFQKWAVMTAEHVDGANTGPKDWDAEFLGEIRGRMPELRKGRDYKSWVRLLDALAGTGREAAAGRAGAA